MEREIVITDYNSRLLSVLYEDNQPTELRLESDADGIHVGDIRIGKIKNIVPNIQAAFVEIAPKIIGYYSLRDNPTHFFVNAKKNNKPVAGDEILVQVEKENLKTKAWILTSRLSLLGKFSILRVSPYDALQNGASSVFVSSKIQDTEKIQHLQSLGTFCETDLSKDTPSPMTKNWVMRTEAAHQDDSTILGEMHTLLSDCEKIMAIYRNRTCFSRLRSGDNLYLQMIRQTFSQGTTRILTDIPTVYEKLVQTLPKNTDLVLYNDSYPLIKLKNIEAQIEKALQKRVWLKSGAYLVIEHTEAMTVIDVNTGKAIDGKQNIEDNFFAINMEAACEVCKQLRLRNISGIIVVDFINMKDKQHLQKLMESLRQWASRDSIQTTIVDRTALQLVEITRKKQYRTLYEQLHT